MRPYTQALGSDRPGMATPKNPNARPYETAVKGDNGPPLPDSYVPEWMTRLCKCNHVDTIHDGPCGGRTANQNGPATKCKCKVFRPMPVTDRRQIALRGWVSPKNKARELVAA